MIDYLTVTKRYFSEWLDVSASLVDSAGIFSVCSKKRDQKQKGYGRQFPLYCFIIDNLAILSHSENIQEQITKLTKALNAEFAIENFERVIEKTFDKKPGHARKYYFTQLPRGIDISSARQLTIADYADFFKFHKAQYPKADQDTWLEEYFIRIADQGYIFAVYEGSNIASATDAPDVPYMADLIVEPGIATLESFRRRGYAKVVLAALIKHLISLGKVPIWSCSAANIASSRLAESVGFKQLGEVIYLSNE